MTPRRKLSPFERLWLWRHNICPKHLMERKGCGRYTHCDGCVIEERQRYAAKMRSIRERLGK